MSWPDLLRTLAREPVIHFLFIGGLLLSADRALDHSSPTGEDEQERTRRTIQVKGASRVRLIERFRERRDREPTSVEMESLIERYIDDEVKYREALALGLERGDPVIRRRLIQRLEFLVEDLARVADPDDDELREFMRAHGERYQRPTQLDGTHVFLRPEHRPRAAQVRAALLAGEAPEGLGDPFLHGRTFASASRIRLASLMGESFADAALALPVGTWSEAIDSSYGSHLVRIDRRISGGLHDLDAIRARVVADWRQQARARAAEQALQDMRRHYRVQRSAGDDPSPTEGQ